MMSNRISAIRISHNNFTILRSGDKRNGEPCTTGRSKRQKIQTNSIHKKGEFVRFQYIRFDLNDGNDSVSCG